MRRNGLLVSGWAVATLLALVFGLQGIRSVSNSVTDHRPAPLSPSSVRAALQRSSTSVTTTTTVSASSSTAVVGDGPAGSASASDAVAPHVNGDGGPTASDPASSGDNDAGSSATNPPTTSSSGSGDSSSSSSPSSSQSAAPFEDRVYQLDGGTVAVRFQDGIAHLLWASPNRDEGYRTDQVEESGGEVDVRFRNEQHESRLRAYWDNGPQQEIEERDDG